MARIGEVLKDTFGITGARNGAEQAKGMYWQYEKAGVIFSAALSGIMQVTNPNVYHDVETLDESSTLKNVTRRTALDLISTGGALALGTIGGQPELAVAAKVVYNAVSSKINRDSS